MIVEVDICILDGQHKDDSEMYKHLVSEYGEQYAKRWIETVTVDLEQVKPCYSMPLKSS